MALSARVVEPALTLTLPQLRRALSRRFRTNQARKRGAKSLYALAQEAGVQREQFYMVIHGAKTSRRLRVLLERYALTGNLG
ncbi:MAG TPA: hypothetical protein VFG76_04275 [Candidatus Polarisedimenticolia bacterium]|nr:hypothetical protein [Candidatus Polarisedimenticolia bacterium]